MKSGKRVVLLGGTSIASCAFMFSGGVLAQDTGAQVAPATGGAVLETIYVQGDNITRDLQDTASSVAVITGEDLDTRPEEYSVQTAIEGVPNVSYYGTIGTAPVIRGQDSQGPNTGAVAYLAGTVPRATINVDGRYLTYAEFVYGMNSIWDVDSIEVFRGPQTTSQGANSIAGAIIVNTKDPTFTPEGALRAEYGSYNTHRVSGMLSGGLSQDLAARVALDYYGRDTFIDYISSTFDEGMADLDIMSFDGRAKLLWEPSEIPGLSAMLTYATSQNNQPTSESAMEPYDSLNNTASAMPSFYQRVHTGISDISYEFENGITLSNQGVYSDYYMKRTTNPVNAGTAYVNENTWSDEAKISFGDEASTLSGVAGVYFAYSESDEYLSPFAAGGGIAESQFDDTENSLGIFTEVDYRFLERWTLTGGLRFQADWKSRVGQSGWATNTPGAPNGEVDYNESFNAFLPKVALAYDVTPDVTVGGLISRGYNPGGVSIDLGNRRWNTFEEETAWNYEIFSRANLLEDRLFVSGNVFFTDLTNAQRFVTTELSPGVNGTYTLNADKAYTYGLELAATYQVLDNLRFNASAGLLKSEITEFDDSEALEGNEFANAPGYMFGLGVEWYVTDKFMIAANVRHTDGYFSDDENTPAFAVDPYTIANARASYQIHDNLQVYGYVDNIFDERVPTYLQSTRDSTSSIVTEGYMTAPRMFGLGLKATF